DAAVVVAGDDVALGSDGSADAVVVSAGGEFDAATRVAEIFRAVEIGADHVALDAVAVGGGEIEDEPTDAVGADDVAGVFAADDIVGLRDFDAVATIAEPI